MPAPYANQVPVATCSPHRWGPRRAWAQAIRKGATPLLVAVLASVAGLGTGLFTRHAHANKTCTAPAGSAPCQTPASLNQNGTEPHINLGAGNPIHLASGNKYQYETDLLPSARWPLLAITRHYSAQSRRRSFMGQGWQSDFDLRLRIRGQHAVIEQADGGVVRFDQVGTQYGASVHGQLQIEASGWLWVWPNGRQMRFNPQGWLVSVHWPDAGVLKIKRHTQTGPLLGAIQTVSAGTVALHFAYTEHAGRAYVQHIDSPVGRFSYEYEAATPSPHQRLTAMQRPDGSRRLYFYEAGLQSGNPFALTGIENIGAPPGGTRLRRGRWAYNPANQVVEFDHNGQAYQVAYLRQSSPTPLTQLRSAAGETTNIHFSTQQGQRRVAAVTGAACPGCPAPGTRAQYDAQGLITAINGTQVLRDARARLRQLKPAHAGWSGLQLDYDLNGRRYAWASALTGREVLSFSAQGHVLQRRFADGGTWHYGYDTGGRPVQVNARAAASPDATHTALQWRGRHLTRVDHPHESETRRYDDLGRLVERTLTRPGHGRGANHRPFTEYFTYDAHHRLTRHTLAEGGALHYTWGHGHQLLRLIWETAQGPRHTVIDTPPGAFGYQYGNGLHFVTLRRPGQAWLALFGGQDPPDAAAADHKLAVATAVRAQRYQFGAHGQVIAEQIFQGQTQGTAPAQPAFESWYYTHDRHARLIGAQRRGPGKPATTHWYAYDDNGAMLASTLRDESDDNTGSTVHTRPNIRRNAGGLPTHIDDRRLEYGADRRLKAVWRGKHLLARYEHNAFGQQIRSIRRHRDDGTQSTTDYWYLDRRLVAESNGSTSNTAEPMVSRRYLYAGHAPVGFIDYSAQQPGGTLYFVHADLTGAPRWVSDAGQNIRWEAQYQPYGQARTITPGAQTLSAGTEPLALNLRAPGQYYDTATGWHDNLLRTYDPGHGHYLEPDPLGPVPGNQALGYAAQQPRRFTDPLGLLLFAFDGTRNDTSTATNIWKLSQRYREGQVFYQAGPGNPYSTDWDAVTAYSAPRIIDAQWNALLELLAATPTSPAQAVPIDIIGYSRGAALARHFGNQLSQYISHGQFSYHDLQRGLVTACVDLRFMGLFDTVAQFGLNGLQNTAYDLTIDAGWQWVAHAVALHERRWLFPLTAAADANPGNVVEAPFVGAHADIGGGVLYDEAGQPSRRGDLSDISLNWMLWQARAAGVEFGDGPLEDGEVSAPYLHDDRNSTLRALQNGDRHLDRANGSLWHNYQDDHARLGRQARDITEQFITRYDDWRRQPGNEVGTVDMDAYSQWLDSTLAWPATPTGS